MNLPKTIVLFLLRAYKWAISPMFLPACRYVPSCAEYAIEAVDRYGAARGGLMAVVRVLRCNPFAKGGLDLTVKPETRLHGSGVGLPQTTDLCGH
jgi:putative membrane protein insertion efficiency factor